MSDYDDEGVEKTGSHIASKLGCGCGCLPAILLLLCGIVLYALVMMGKFNYSLNATMSLVAYGLIGLGTLTGMLGALLAILGMILNKKKG